MGVPALFRWLSAKYPKIVTPVIEEVQDENSKINLSGINPNGLEFDNLYLDMNGIIHPCCHPEGKEAPETEEEMMKEIFKYIDRIFAMIRPRRLLYLAIDGVAPRAKMNQQRSRRFRAAQESKEKQNKKEELRAEMLKKEDLNDAEDNGEEDGSNFDSNCITPGTPFMDLISRSLKYYIYDKINSESAWRQISVILSDASVPGEGEHKIVDYIRKQRLEPNYDPNQHNVIYGLDADLIMLSMATHESRFHVLREDVFADEKKGSNCYSCGKPGHIAENCRSVSKSNGEEEVSTLVKSALDVAAHPKPFIFLQVHILREYLEAELKPQRPMSFEFNLERAIDDWIFLCFFVGNDFLPHLPSLELREGAIDILLKIYKESQSFMGGYICNGGKVDLKRAQIVMEGLAKVEPAIFEKRQLKDERRLENINRRKALEAEEAALLQPSKRKSPSSSEEHNDSFKKLKHESDSLEICSPHESGQSGVNVIEIQKKIRMNNIEAARALKANLLAQAESASSIESSSVTTNSTDSTTSLPQSTVTTDSEAPVDIVRLWEPGARERYYVSKFNINPDDVDAFAKKVAFSYAEGLCWVLAYYYRGCPSWKWFYPYHYAPFASDLIDIANLDIEFELGEPFRPFDQLMAVFPAASRVHIPPTFHHLMTNHDSEIIDFYPEDFLIDMNGKRAAWQGVALLPFIEEARLLKALNKLYPELTEAELRRNQRGTDLIYTSTNTNLGKWLIENHGNDSKPEEFTEIPSHATPPIARVSTIDHDENSVAIGKPFPSHIESLPDVFNSKCIMAKLLLHTHSVDNYKFDLLPGVIPPDRILDDNDIYMLRSGASAQKFPNILSYGNGSSRHHSMHRDTRDQMMRTDSGYNSNRNYNYNGYQRRDRNEDYSRRDGSPNSNGSYDRFAEYGNANISGPYDLNDNSQNYGRSAYRPNNNNYKFNNRYNRR